MGLRGFKAEAQAVAFEDGRHAEPVDVVVGRDRLITVPGLVVRRLAGIVQAKPVFLTDVQAAGLEVEPLKVIALGIGADRQQGLERVAEVNDLNVAAVEIGTDVERGFSHGQGS
ncbi:hypothetical protein D3C86_808520 [compost metagenome]